MSHLSFFAGLPVMLASPQDKTCGPLFALSAALYFLSAVVVLVTWPRRVHLSDLLHGITLLVNGLVTANATTLLYNATSEEGNSQTKTMLRQLGICITVLTVIRVVHNIVLLTFRFLVRRGHIDGMLVAAGSHHQQVTSPRHFIFKIVNPSTREYSGILWKLLPPIVLAPHKSRMSDVLFDGLDVLLLNKEEVTEKKDVVRTEDPVDMKTYTKNASASSQSATGTEPRASPVSIVLPHFFFKAREIESDSDDDSALYLTEEEIFRRKIARDYSQVNK